jgi:hypothetical protein
MPLLDRALPGRRLIEDVAALSFALERWIGLLMWRNVYYWLHILCNVKLTARSVPTAIMRARQATMHKVLEGARLVQEQTSGLSPSTRFPHE